MPKAPIKNHERQISAFRTLAARGTTAETAAAFEKVVRRIAKPQPKKKTDAKRGALKPRAHKK